MRKLCTRNVIAGGGSSDLAAHHVVRQNGEYDKGEKEIAIHLQLLGLARQHELIP